MISCGCLLIDVSRPTSRLLRFPVAQSPQLLALQVASRADYEAPGPRDVLGERAVSPRESLREVTGRASHRGPANHSGEIQDSHLGWCLCLHQPITSVSPVIQGLVRSRELCEGLLHQNLHHLHTELAWEGDRQAGQSHSKDAKA